MKLSVTGEELQAMTANANAACLPTSIWARKIIMDAIAPIDPTKPMRQKRQPL